MTASEDEFLFQKEQELREREQSELNMIEEEYLERREINQLHQPKYRTEYSTNHMPIIPIDPQVLRVKIQEHMESHGIVFSDKTASVIEEMCKLFNFDIECNQKGIKNTFIFPAQTGLGKSLSLQLYVSLLKRESSMIIVSKVDEAIKYCEFINHQSGNKDYARCFFTITNQNKDNAVRVEVKDLLHHRCIVITHAMFRAINQKSKIDIFKLYKKKPRDLVVIDEKIKFYEQYQVTNKEVDQLIKKVDTIYTNSKWLLHLDAMQEIYAFLTEMGNLFSSYDKHILKNKPVIHIENNEVAYLDIEKNIELIEYVFNSRVEEIFEELKLIGELSNVNFKNNISNKIIELLTNMKEVLDGDFVYFHGDRRKKTFFKTKNILNQLGSSIVLDATANLNEFYKVANRYGSNIVYVPAEQVRIYKNLNIYKAKGYPQSRYAIYKQEPNVIKANAEIYLSYALSELKNVSDKMLIICHEKFKSYMQLANTDQRIVFTHWGDHIGKNDWSDCNKVMVVGWNSLDPMVHISNIYNAIGEMDVASDLISDEVLNNFRKTQVADDLVQAVMRSKARKIVSLDSDCNEADVYLFYEENEDNLEILQLFESQFPQANILNWQPIGKPLQKKKTKPQENTHRVIDHLKEQALHNQTYLLNDVIKKLKINKTTMNRLMKNPFFIEQMEEKGYRLDKKDGKSIYFIL